MLLVGLQSLAQGLAVNRRTVPVKMPPCVLVNPTIFHIVGGIVCFTSRPGMGQKFEG